MVRVSVEKIVELQKNTKNIRNICILAHVDHGKTTLADTLIASNEIISQRLAGQLRYMDSRPDEQERQITMKSSSISLFYPAKDGEEYLVNLIDSPGHVDFSSEVSTAVRLCDGGIIVVDAVEGVCAQTRICLQQAYNENLQTVLFINKLDRLIFEMNLSPEDAFRRISQIVEQINAVLGNIFASDVLKNETETQQSALEDSDDSNLYFEPERNIIFGAALHSWGFRIQDFAAMYATKFGVDAGELLKGLWGDFYFNPSSKQCKAGAFDKGKKPMFVSLILEPIWKIYNIAREKQVSDFETFSAKLGVKLTRRDLNFTDLKVPIKAMFSQWLPLDRAILDEVIRLTPSPRSIPEQKVLKLMSTNVKDFSSLPMETQKVKVTLTESNPESSTVIAFVSKMFSVDVKTQIQGLGKLQTVKDAEEPGDIFVAFARVYSGILRKGQKLLVLGPKHKPQNENSQYVTEFIVNDLYLLMGRGLESIEEVPAGNIVGIGGLENIIHKTATIASTPFCPPFVDLPVIATPILRVAVEPTSLANMNKLISGLKLLNQADPCVQVLVQDTGEHVLLTLGQVHLERCIKDLEETFAKCELNVSKPIVSFRETIVKYVPPESDEPEEVVDEPSEVTIQTPNKLCTIQIQAVPLPLEVIAILDKYSELVKNLLENRPATIPEKLKDELLKELCTEEIGLKSLSQIWSIGSRKCPLNVLINLTDYENASHFQENEASRTDFRSSYDHSFINGFQLATQAGPICEEAVQGVAYLVKDWTIQETEDHQYGPFSGQIISTVKEACKRAFQNQPQRLVTPMYSCSIVVDSNALNKMYAVIGKRHGQIISADLIEGSGQFCVMAHIPVMESFNFAQQIRTETSGLAMPQLVFSHWQTIDEDPYWVPRTKDEMEHFGDKSDTVNIAKTYMDSVRERKGLHVEKHIVEHAEKQRTLSKNK